MKKYWILFKQFYQLRLEYRIDMIIYSAGTAVMPLVGLAVWLTVASASTLPYSNSELIAYFIAAIYIGIMTEMWQSWFINEDIIDGYFTSIFLRPMSLLGRYIVENLSDKIFKALVVTISVPILYFVIPKNVWSSFHINFLTILLFALAVILGYLIFFFFELSIGLSTVWVYEISFLKHSLGFAHNFFSGRLIPIAFFPIFFGSVLMYLPFRFAISFPAEIILNKIDEAEMIKGFMIGAIWLVISFLTYLIVLTKFKKSFQGFGL